MWPKSTLNGETPQNGSVHTPPMGNCPWPSERVRTRTARVRPTRHGQSPIIGFTSTPTRQPYPHHQHAVRMDTSTHLNHHFQAIGNCQWRDRALRARAIGHCPWRDGARTRVRARHGQWPSAPSVFTKISAP
eukprot:TRINITY_DN67111_c0_g3_i1.p4 TRINITY_DN67111_c0_g3~~TRINITY_DN67111_c0_g3_i1.p4  ORF type:complete len:132 (+),score=17.30 TRINITY_DN67111_c0_g3_i1:1912-2307(+)